MKRLLFALLPALLMALLLWGSAAMPRHLEFLESALSPELPLGYELPGWYGWRTQESAEERATLAADTRFSKGFYVKRRESETAPHNPAISVSLIYSGNDMNHSIHRPEGCLPAQGHLSLSGSKDSIRLVNGQQLAFTRLSSVTPDVRNPRDFIHHIHYYVFVGHNTIVSSHLARVVIDIADRATSGRVQRWAYFQAGTQWGGSTGFTQEQAEAQLRACVEELLPNLVDWSAVNSE